VKPCLLVVDDEAMLRDLLRRYLERAGYEVVACAGAAEALEQFAAAPARYALVLTDLALDGMDGEELLQRMREIDPGVRGIVASGYPHQPRLPGVGFLQKPFLPKMLAEAVAQALAGPPR
jgi:two-component system cell cycle sensor histidine kinase/response regulator CckA